MKQKALLFFLPTKEVGACADNLTIQHFLGTFWKELLTGKIL